MNYKELHNYIISKINLLYDKNESESIADIVFEHFLSTTKAQRILNQAKDVDNEQKMIVEEVVERLLNNEPIQYITNVAWFMGLELKVTEEVLIPRPETEELVQLIINENIDNKKHLRILEVGSGSGCISIALKKHLYNTEIFATDFSIDALHVAKLNARRNNINITFVYDDLFDSTVFAPEMFFDIIISNPPYICEKEKKLMKKNVLNYEPHDALFVPDNEPIIFYKTILEKNLLNTNKENCIWFEINPQYAEEIITFAKKINYRDMKLFKDFRNNNRFLKITK